MNTQIFDSVIKMVEDSDNVSSVIENLLDELGNKYGLDSICIIQFLSDDAIKCTFEWNLDGRKELLNVEHRYLSNLKSEWIEHYNDERGYWLFRSSSAKRPVSFARHDILESMVEMPIYKNEQCVGCVDFISRDVMKDYYPEMIGDLKGLVRILSSYLLPLRELEINRDKIDSISEYDAICHLPKYEIFKRDVSNYLERMDETQVCFLSLDFSNFKYVNEKYGHIAGNAILLKVAKRIYEECNNIISCCRPYSDNFVIAVQSSSIYTYNMIREKFETNCRIFSEELREAFFDLNIILNVGIYYMHKGEKDIESAITNANIARKFAKNTKTSGNCRIMMYNVAMSLQQRKQSEMIAAMSKGIIDKEFYIQFQPICMTDTFKMIGAEALVRWHKDNSDNLMPVEFISIFEHTGGIIKLDYYVYDRVFAYIHDWLAAGYDVVPISVNVSSMHFNTTDLLDYVAGLLDKYKIPAKYVEFEFSEQVYISNNPNVTTVFEGLKNMGFKIFIDNFGTGFSSLNTLTKYNIDGIKLDRNFMKPRLDRNDKIIIQGVVNLANRLGLEMFAEGVESEEQRMFLLMNECPYMQGFYFSKPVDSDYFEYMLENQ